MRPSFSVSIAVLYPLPTSPRTFARRHSAVVQNQFARAARPDAELVFLFSDRKSGKAPLDHECRDAAVAGIRIHRGEHDEDVRLVGIRDPQLASCEKEIVAVRLRACREGEGIAARAGFGERIGADGVGSKSRQVTLPELFRPPAQQCVDDECVLNVDEHANRRIDP